MSIPTHAVWMEKTAGAFYEQRNAYLKGLDAAILAYAAHVGSSEARAFVKQALDAYLTDHQRRKGDDSWKRSIRNKQGALEALRDEFYKKPVPQVIEPPPPPPPPPLPPTPPSIVRDPTTRKTIEALMVRRQPIHVLRNQATSQAETAIFTQLTSLSTDLNAMRAMILAASERARNEFFNASNTAFDSFEELHKKDAQDLDFKLNIAKKIFEAMEGLPFPLSFVGKAGSAVAGQLRTSTYEGSTNIIQTTSPATSALMTKVKAATDAFDDLQTLNVSPSKLSMGRSSFQNDFRVAFDTFEKNLTKSWDDTLKAFRDDQSRRAFAKDLMSASETGVELKPSDPSGTLWWINRTQKLKTELIAMKDTIGSEFKPFTDMNLISHGEVARWIVVLLIADYAISGLFAGKDVIQLTAAELADARFSDTFAHFLGDDKVRVLEVKTGSGQSSAIWDGSRIPWQGHPNHKVGTLLYLNWVRKDLNPFKFFNRQDTPEAFVKRSQTYIHSLGRAIRANEVTPRIGHKTIDDLQAVVSALP